MTWHDAEQYCDRKGGYLAEPSNPQENNFLVGRVRALGSINWWLGMREVQDCQCSGTVAGRSSTSQALIDQEDLRNSRNIGYVNTFCQAGGCERHSAERLTWKFYRTFF